MREEYHTGGLNKDIWERIGSLCMASSTVLLSPAETAAWAEENKIHGPLDGSPFSVFQLKLDTPLCAVNQSFRMMVRSCKSKCVKRKSWHALYG